MGSFVKIGIMVAALAVTASCRNTEVSRDDTSVSYTHLTLPTILRV